MLFINEYNDRVETTHKRDVDIPADTPSGWECASHDAFPKAWRSLGDWTLYIKGEIPVKRKTADHLETGVYFKGTHKNSLKPDAFMMKGGGDWVFFADDMNLSSYPGRDMGSLGSSRKIRGDK
ncbi:hypothetical protein [uncultured Rothia sp.]|uniref:hypothetical protein n=1 Tax=uncultured Rothia sp. TaxID=316088 RepID=UPI003217592B